MELNERKLKILRSIIDEYIDHGEPVGSKYLMQSGISVKIIESDLTRCNELTNLLPENVIIVNGNGTDESILMQEDLPQTDVFIPLTGIDEENVLLSLYSMKVAPNIKAITKVYLTQYVQ